MNVARRRVLEWVGFGALAVAVPGFAWARASDGAGEMQLAMGPVSAAQLPGGKVPAPNATAHPCAQAEKPCLAPRLRWRRRRARRRQ
jgi:hypothetical protein